MRKFAFIFTAIFSLLIGPQPTPASAHVSGNPIIHMTDKGYEPQTLTIEKGTTVEFENTSQDPRWPASNLHPTHELYPEFDPKQGIKPGEIWSFTFDKPGTWKMHDHIYPEFSGTITVTGEADKTTTATAEPKGFWGKTWFHIKNFFYRLTHWGKLPENKDAGREIDIKNYDKEVSETSEEIFNNDELLGSYLKKYGPQKTITRLRLLENKFGSCHQPAHRAGHIGYQLYADKAFVEYSAECQSGYYHGVMEAYLKEHGTENLQESLSKLCQSGLNPFFEHQCIHGIGHGIMAYANYELPDALRDCDLLPKRQDSCWTGVFMENLGAKLASDKTVKGSTPVGQTDIHVTKYLSEDPQFPCDSVDEKYKGSCYFLQTSRMLQIFGVDFQKIADACSKAPSQHQGSCFGSMGRDVGGAFPKDMQREIDECGYVTDGVHRIECLNGAVQNSFWDPTGQDLALDFCKRLKLAEEKNACYNTIFDRAPQVIFNSGDLEAFCKKAEDVYQDRCRAYIPKS